MTSSHNTYNKNELIVSPASVGDIDSLYELIQNSMHSYQLVSGVPEGCLSALKETKADLKNAILNSLVLKAESPEKIFLGTVRLEKISISDTPLAIQKVFPNNSNNIYGMYYSRFSVNPSIHGNGVGNVIFDVALNVIKNSGCRFIFLHTSTANKKLFDFYSKRGFKVVELNHDKGYPRGTFLKII